jgi:hypothetical protein
MPSAPLSPAQEARAQQPAADLQQALANELLAIARSLIANEQRRFGTAEFQLRASDRAFSRNCLTNCPDTGKPILISP